MLSLYAVLCAWLVHSWLPPDPRARLAAITGRRRLAADERVVAWWQGRATRTPGQPRTTVLLEMLISELAAGSIPPHAFAHVLGEAVTSPEALSAAPPTVDVRVWSDVANVWTACDEAGFSLVAALRRIHAYALVDQEVTREVQATAAAPRMALAMVIAMPVAAWAVAGMIGADPLGFLLHNPVGWACCAVAILLDASAVLIMRNLARRAMA